MSECLLSKWQLHISHDNLMCSNVTFLTARYCENHLDMIVFAYFFLNIVSKTFSTRKIFPKSRELEKVIMK